MHCGDCTQVLQARKQLSQHQSAHWAVSSWHHSAFFKPWQPQGSVSNLLQCGAQVSQHISMLPPSCVPKSLSAEWLSEAPQLSLANRELMQACTKQSQHQAQPCSQCQLQPTSQLTAHAHCTLSGLLSLSVRPLLAKSPSSTPHLWPF